MIKGGQGGANTNRNGIPFEKKTDFSQMVSSLKEYQIEEINFKDKKKSKAYKVYRNAKLIGKIMSKHRFYNFLADENIESTNSKGWLPDEAFINFENHTVYIIEKKWQEVKGSVDEKLLGLGNKRRLYQRLLDKAENPYSVQFVFVGNDYFLNEEHKDVLEMLRGDGVTIMIDKIDMKFFGLYQEGYYDNLGRI